MTWDDAWAEFEPRLAELAADVQAKTGAAPLWGRITGGFAFGAYLSFGRHGDASRDDVVVSIDANHTPDGVLLTCDIAREKGYVLKDLPAVTVVGSELESSPDIARWVADVSAFLRAETPLIVDELLNGATGVDD